MNMNQTPKGNRLHIALFGNRNAGKSSLINALTGQALSIVSDTPGTTTDPVEKAYELQPIGPVLFIDTAGIDDAGSLGQARVKKTQDVLKRTDIALVIVDATAAAESLAKFIKQIQEQELPWIGILNKCDLLDDSSVKEKIAQLSVQYQQKFCAISAANGNGLEILREYLAKQSMSLTPEPPIVADLVQSPNTVLLVVPIDKEAPKGRLILPQVQTIRELLDADISVMVVKDRELHYTLNQVLKQPPKLVITDSQAFLKVDADVPSSILLTSFSILFARQKGDLDTYSKGARTISTLKTGDKVLIAEACSHRPVTEDIGRVKIPRWIAQYTGAKPEFTVLSGKDFPEDLSPYKLVIQCGGCTVNRQLILSRIRQARNQGVAITNYGIAIAYLHGILDRAMKPFE